MELPESRLSIKNEMDITRAILETGSFCETMGFNRIQSHMVATAVSELARNIMKYASQGKVILRQVVRAASKGVEVVAEDQGPGIEDLELALQDQFSSSGTLGLGLPGIKRMMDDFEIETEAGRGTRVTIRKWL